ncbi:MAG: cellulase family glycosylhydrolase [Deltaproteobacteria bacterium]|nr:cellulase family glycosylhydrolase [Deltaproteobacteria bacterium]
MSKHTFSPLLLISVIVVLGIIACTDGWNNADEKKTDDAGDIGQSNRGDSASSNDNGEGHNDADDGNTGQATDENTGNANSGNDTSGSGDDMDSNDDSAGNGSNTDNGNGDTSNAGNDNNSGDDTLDDKYRPDGDVTPATQASGFLHVDGNLLVDDNGNNTRLTGVNWFGFETGNLSPHGLWARDYRSMMKQIADMGFNTVRIPWCNEMLREGAATQSINTYGADPYDGTDPMNGDLEDLPPIEVMDKVIDAAGAAGLKVMLDNHSRNPDGYMEEDLWYTDSCPESQWVEDWVFMAQRYKGNTTVIAFDLNNEPHDGATWGAGVAATDWDKAAERCGTAIQEVNSDVLIVIEGIEEWKDTGYWWGGNLRGVKDDPISLPVQEKLVYSAHEYGPEVFAQPWFESADFPGNLPKIWYENFGYVVASETSHMFIGEFGVRDLESAGGVAGEWFFTFLDFMNERDGYSWTFWSLNPNSGDTEGILTYDWVTPHDWKLEALKPYMAPKIN